MHDWNTKCNCLAFAMNLNASLLIGEGRRIDGKYNYSFSPKGIFQERERERNDEIAFEYSLAPSETMWVRVPIWRRHTQQHSKLLSCQWGPSSRHNYYLIVKLSPALAIIRRYFFPFVPIAISWYNYCLSIACVCVCLISLSRWSSP